MRTLAVAVLFVLSTPAVSWSQVPPAPATASKETVVAGERYRRSGLYQWLFGSGYRDLWTTPFAIEILDLKSFGGGLTPTRVVGAGQSRGLAFKGGDGRLYTFRPLLKDPSGLLPVELRETFARGFVVDQMASGHPAGHVIVGPLYRAVGITHNEAQLVTMPDDPALGEFRTEFKGQLGDIEEFGGSPGIIQAEENIDGEELWKRTREDPSLRVDARAYLRARLVDQIIGDWDRHRNQWRWAKIAGKELWQPIPEDRDQAFVKFNGMVISSIRPGLPLLVDYGPKYSSLEGLTFDGWDVDRRLLAELPASVYDEEAGKVRSALTDAVIDAAVRRMPPEFYAKNGATLTAAIKARRDNVTTQAKEFYRFLSKSVDIYGTDVAEVVNVDRAPSGDVTVSVAAEGQEPYFRRTFNKNDTSEIRLLLFGGNDRVVTKGDAAGPKVRAVGGDGDDVVDDSAGGRTRFYDSGTADKVVAGKGTSWDRGLFTPPPANRSGAWIPPRDWGRQTIVMPTLSGGSDLGLVAGLSMTSTGYAFRRFPYAGQHQLSLTFSTAVKAFRGVYAYDRKLENSKLSLGLTAAASGYGILRFYGFGNETPSFEPDDDIAKIENDQFVLAPRITVPIGKMELSFEAVGKYTKTDRRDNPLFPVFPSEVPLSSANSFVTTDDIGQVGAGFEGRLDTTDKPAWPSRGLKLWVGGHAYPSAWDLEDPFGEVHGEVSTYLSPSVPGKVVLMLRGGGKRVFGDHPYFESAFLGGRASTTIAGLGDDPGLVRGLRPQRYAGDGVLYGNAELRISLGNVFVLVPGELGIHGLFDVGRVYLEDDPSSKWHHGVGGGLWFASPNRRNVVTLSIAKSEGRTGLYIQAGLAF